MLERERESDRSRSVGSAESWVEQTRKLVQAGIESLDRGEGVDGETVVTDLLAKLRSTKGSV
jgi:antitoxin ParD1/3/4